MKVKVEECINVKEVEESFHTWPWGKGYSYRTWFKGG